MLSRTHVNKLQVFGSVFKVQSSKFSVQCSKFKVPSSKFSVQCSVFSVQSSWFEVWSSIYLVRYSLFEVWCRCSMYAVCKRLRFFFYRYRHTFWNSIPSSKFSVQCSMFKVPSSVFSVQCSKFLVWSLKFDVYISMFLVWCTMTMCDVCCLQAIEILFLSTLLMAGASACWNRRNMIICLNICDKSYEHRTSLLGLCHDEQIST